MARVSAATPPPAGLPAELTPGRCLVMAVVNVTPDSFSDGGRHLCSDAAIAHGQELVRRGADLVDVGGESTRPGAARVPADEERRRVIPVVRALADDGIAVSIDTMRAGTAEAALDAGAILVNDVSGGKADTEMWPVVRDRRVPYVVMHWRGYSEQMQARAHYDDVVGEVCAELQQTLAAAVDAGVDERQIAIDPGLGFAKLPEHNWALLARLEALHALGRPVMVGASRKRFLGELLGAGDSEGTRDAATAALSTLAAAGGAWAVRVHEAAGSAAAVRVAARLAEEVRDGS